MKNFQKGGGDTSEVLKFCDFGRGSQKKKSKKNCVFRKNNSILRTFLVKCWFEKPVLSSAQRAQNKHKKNWRAQAKLLDVLFDDIMHKFKKRNQNFLAIGDRLFGICRAANSKLL